MKRAILFTVVMIVMAVLLRLLNWLPHLISTDTVRAYSSLEQVEGVLGAGKIRMPSYFPNTILWPPEEILAAAKPGKVLLVQFAHRNTGNIVLSIRKRESAGEKLPSRIEPVRLLRSSKLALKGVEATLDVAFCADKRPCNRITWKRNTEEVSLIFRGPVLELTKLAESMLAG